MTKFIPAAIALVALGASLSPAFADGDRVSHDTSLVNTYSAAQAPASTATPNVGSFHYNGAEAYIINHSDADTGR